MPNHITNELTITGHGPLVEACVARLETKEAPVREIDFNNIIKQPDVFSEIVCGMTTIDGVKVVRWREVPNPAHGTGPGESPTITVAVTAEEMADLLMKHGADNWRDWACANWGTKWNCYDISDWWVAPDQDENGRAIIKFDTAWSTPTEAMKALSEQWPALCFEIKYADEDIGHNCGSYTLMAGIIEEKLLLNGESAVKYACEMKGWDYQEYLQDQADEE